MEWEEVTEHDNELGADVQVWRTRTRQYSSRRYRIQHQHDPKGGWVISVLIAKKEGWSDGTPWLINGNKLEQFFTTLQDAKFAAELVEISFVAFVQGFVADIKSTYEY